jgi:hypothetical protein
LIERHEILRTTLEILDNDEGVQVIQSAKIWLLEEGALTREDEKSLLTDYAKQSFHIGKEILFQSKVMVCKK